VGAGFSPEPGLNGVFSFLIGGVVISAMFTS
jgi:hypothetical protein